MVAAPFHAAPVDQVSASTGDDVAAAHVHGDAHHPVGGHAAAGGGDHGGHMTSAGLRVKVVPPAALAVQLSVGVVGVGRAAARRHGISANVLVRILPVEKLACHNSHMVPFV